MMKTEYTLTIYGENHIGLLNKISTLFTRRKLNIESFSTSPCEVENVYRFTIVIVETAEIVRKLCKQIEKIIDVLKVYFNTNNEIVWQEMALYKVATNVIAKDIVVERLSHQYGARVVVIRTDFVVLEVTGQKTEIDRMTEYLQPFGLIEFVRTGRIAIIKSSHGFHDKIKEFNRLQPSKEMVKQNTFLNKNKEVFSM